MSIINFKDGTFDMIESKEDFERVIFEKLGYEISKKFGEIIEGLVENCEDLRSSIDDLECELDYLNEENSELRYELNK